MCLILFNTFVSYIYKRISRFISIRTLRSNFGTFKKQNLVEYNKEYDAYRSIIHSKDETWIGKIHGILNYSDSYDILIVSLNDYSLFCIRISHTEYQRMDIKKYQIISANGLPKYNLEYNYWELIDPKLITIY